MGISNLNDSCYKLQQLSVIKSHEKINDFILYIDGPLLTFRGYAHNCKDLRDQESTLYMIESNVIRKVIAIVNHLKKYGNCVKIKIYYDGQSPNMKKLTQQKRNKDVFPHNLTYRQINSFIQQHIVYNLYDKLHSPKMKIEDIELVNLEVGEAENEMYRRRDTNYSSVMFTKDTDVFAISYNHQPKTPNDIVYMYDGDYIYNMNRFTCGLDNFQFRTLVSLSGTDFNCTIFTPTMIKAIVEVFLLKRINNSQDLFKQLLYFNNYKENCIAYDGDVNNENLNMENIKQNELSATNQHEYNDYEMYQRLLKNNIISPTDILKKNIQETNAEKMITPKIDKKMCENYNHDTKQKIMNSVDLDIIIHRILQNYTDIEALICDFLLMIYYLKTLNYKNIRLPQKEKDNYNPIFMKNDGVLKNFIINIDWVINYYNMGSDYTEYNLNFQRYENINKLSCLQYIFCKRFDTFSPIYKKLFNISTICNYSNNNNSDDNYSINSKKIKTF